MGAVPMWSMLMNFSKFVELFDTAFIVLRKRPLIFLHWYHHVTVLLFCWSAYSIPTGSGIYFIAMNYSVHAIMYGYYGLKALDLCPKAFPASIITNIQTAQMFIGTFICLSAWLYRYNGVTCHNDIMNLAAGAFMYASYLYLFVDFAVKKYMKTKTLKKAV
jgi:elongation of very long chain fatty acids protein 6